MKKSNLDLNTLLTSISEEKMDLAGEDQKNSGSWNAQTTWAWSAAENKSWTWRDQSWSK
jgi:hypothetical protein